MSSSLTGTPNNYDKESFLSLLQKTVEKRDQKVFATWFDDNGKATNTYTFSELWIEAGFIAHYLRDTLMVNKGDRVILCYNFGLQFFAAFLGCLRAGVTAVLVYPPSRSSLVNSLPKMTKVANDCDAKIILVDSDVNLLKTLDNNNPFSKSRHLWPVDIEFKLHPKFDMKKSTGDLKSLMEYGDLSICATDLAFLQYTSGSTGNPKGVMVTFAALEANVKAIMKSVHGEFDDANVSRENIVGFSWLPQYHDMGLIYAIIAPFAGGWSSNMISPVSFIKNPLLWIDLMSELKVTWSVAPDFGFRLVARKFNEAKERGQDTPIQKLDLSSLVYLQSAAEPIQQSTKEVFETTFSKYGLSNWFHAGYGLAETVVYASHLHEYKLSKLQPTEGRSLISVGHRDNMPDSQIMKIVCPLTLKEMEDGEIGELWLSGPSITAGYFGKPELSKEFFEATLEGYDDKQFLRTGDQAFFEDGYLFICGRLKDLVIVNGVNYYPQDIESVVQDASPAVRPGCIAAFSSDDIGTDEGTLEIVFEVRDSHKREVVDVAHTIRMHVFEKSGLMPTRIAAVKERSILKTASGKIRRKANRAALHDGSLQIVYELDDEKKATLKDEEFGEQFDEQESNTIQVDHFDNVLIPYFGIDFNPDKQWEELGLSSMASVQLRDAIYDCFSISLPPDCFDIYSTPRSLKDFVLNNQGAPLQIILPHVTKVDSISISWSNLGVAQALCSIFLIFAFASAIVPAWYTGKYMANHYAQSFEVHTNKGSIDLTWVWFPIVVPVWMISYSLIVLILKWVCVGRYREGVISLPSFAFLRWWFVDRSMALWEFFVGRFIKDTPLINLFYTLMGAKVHRSATVNAFIREFDLVSIGANVSLDYQIHCRKFGAWDNDSDLASLTFRQTTVEKNSVVKGMLCPGVSIGEGSFVDKQAVVAEGAQVPCRRLVVGSPAFSSGNAEPCWGHSWWKLGLLKLLWITFELYLFFALMLLGQITWSIYLPVDWFYSPLLNWFLLVIWFAGCSIGTSVIIKWTLIGKRVAGSFNDSLWRKAADWAADWHYSTSIQVLYSVTSNSHLWNVILRLHGMDVDMGSQVFAHRFLPSQMDLIKVRSSFISSGAMFDIKKKNAYYETEVSESSIGWWVRVGPGVQISKAVVSPSVHVTESIIKHEYDERFEHVSFFSLLKREMLMISGYIMLVVAILLSLVPSFELWMRAITPTSIWTSVATLSLAIMVQMVSWTILFAIIQSIALTGSSKNTKPWSVVAYAIYGTMYSAYQNWAFMSILHGSRIYNLLQRILGCKFEGKALLFSRNEDLPRLYFSDRTIVDSGSTISGHYAVYGTIALGSSNISGVVHEGTFISCSDMTSDQCGPGRTYFGSKDSKSNSSHDTNSSSSQHTSSHLFPLNLNSASVEEITYPIDFSIDEEMGPDSSKGIKNEADFMV